MCEAHSHRMRYCGFHTACFMIMIFQFFADWKLDKHPRRPPPTPMCRHQPSSSMTMDSFLSTERCTIDWRDEKQTWSFQRDYVSFPSLEPQDTDHGHP
ncbi:hypothetical protein BC940DRAFT_334007 [Gongronella butleri]|nr:hypothetical protein BC940DRAFT_334007 [Gongronella butleri]